MYKINEKLSYKPIMSDYKCTLDIKYNIKI